MQATGPVKDPRKQRKLLYNAPAHLRHKLMAALLSPELVASKVAKTLPVRKGDAVRIMRGDHKGFEGKISQVDLKNYRIYIEGLTREKVDGTTLFVPVHPSKVMIRNLNLDDKWRKAVVEAKKETTKKEEKAEKVTRKPPAKAAKVREEKEARRATEEKPVEVKEKVAEAKAAVEEKPGEMKPKAKLTKARRETATEKKKEEKLREKPATKEEKPKAAKRTRAKRKTAEEKKGGM
jgi:large subunit ribosomal protein L24